ncbi:hypothetical protein ACLB1M_33315 [Escherichia coli]
MVTEHELRSEILRPYIVKKTAPRLHIMTGTGGQYDFDDVIQNENTFLSLLSNQIISIKPSGYNITITTIDKKTAQVMKEEYQERIAIIQKKLNNDVSRLEENIKKNRCEIQNASSYDLASSIKWGDQVSKIYACCSTPEQHDGESITDNAANIDFIYFLLSHGYLPTDYMAYRSVFMPGSLSAGRQ